MATAAQLHCAEHWEIKPTFCTNRNMYMFGFCREKQHASLSSNNFPNLHRPLPRIESGVYNKIEDMHDARKGRINVCISIPFKYFNIISRYIYKNRIFFNMIFHQPLIVTVLCLLTIYF